MNDRPFVLVNVAMTADGKLDSYLRKGATISSGQDKTRVDQLRAKMDAILVGGKTLVQEDPKLTVRSSQSRMERVALGVDENPAKVGIVTIADIKHDGDFMSAGSARRLIYTTDCTTPEQASVLEAYGAKVFFLGTDSVDLPKVMES
jgi:2,5-diamino-6-(ribosylamino)-4(3H)-pyrimidinone 5'-phosphate reductase